MSVLEHDVLLNLDLRPLPVKGGAAPDVRNLVTSVALAQDSGFASIILPGLSSGEEGAAPAGFEATTAASFLASRFKRIGFITPVLLPEEHPYLAARQLASIDHVTHGWAGWLLSTARRSVPLDRFEEAVTVVSGLWDGWKEGALRFDRKAGTPVDPALVNQLDHSGRYYKVQGPISSSRPPQEQLPLFIHVGNSPVEEEFAAFYADVAIINAETVKEAVQQALRLRNLANTDNRSGGPLRILATVTPVSGSSSQVARDELLASTGGKIPQGRIVLTDTSEQIVSVLQELLSSKVIDGFNVSLPVETELLSQFTSLVLPELRKSRQPVTIDLQSLRHSYGLGKAQHPPVLQTSNEVAAE